MNSLEIEWKRLERSSSGKKNNKSNGFSFNPVNVSLNPVKSYESKNENSLSKLKMMSNIAKQRESIKNDKVIKNIDFNMKDLNNSLEKSPLKTER